MFITEEIIVITYNSIANIFSLNNILVNGIQYLEIYTMLKIEPNLPF